jgi:hypothetical protein
MTKQVPWFLQDRAVAFASLLLTERGDVKVQPHAGADSAIDLLVEILEDGKPTLRFFGVQLLPSLDLPGIRDADEQVLAHFGKDAVEAALPLCAFLIGVRKPEGLYRWVVEPVVAAGRPALHRDGEANWQTLDETSVARLIGQVEAWYAALQDESAQKRRDRQVKPGA